MHAASTGNKLYKHTPSPHGRNLIPVLDINHTEKYADAHESLLVCWIYTDTRVKKGPQDLKSI